MTNATLFKYPSTPHLHYSRSRTEDDKVLKTDVHLEGKTVIIFEKMDGENASLYSDHYHARSLDSRHHHSRDWLKAFWSGFKNDIPTGFRINGENMWAEHSIRYEALSSYFLGFAMWDDNNYRLTWDETLIYFSLLGITPAPVLYRGPYVSSAVQALVETLDLTKQEGIVVAVDEKYHFTEFSKNVAKWVRPKHVQTDKHWMHSEIKSNGLKNAS